MCCERWSNEAATAHADIWPDQPDVPAFLELLNFGKVLVSSADGTYDVTLSFRFRLAILAH